MLPAQQTNSEARTICLAEALGLNLESCADGQTSASVLIQGATIAGCVVPHSVRLQVSCSDDCNRDLLSKFALKQLQTSCRQALIAIRDRYIA